MSKTENGEMTEKELLDACDSADWGQVALNGGPPCFHLEDRRFCLRAQRWTGHAHALGHQFVSLRDLLGIAVLNFLEMK
jgi:hypothetical protein